MAQNAYDSQAFFDAYSQLPRSVEGLKGAAEWPTMRGLAGDLRGLDVLDLGCGYGWFCRYAVDAGAATVTGYDVSEKMLQKARSFSGSDKVEYKCQDLQSIQLQPSTYDLIYSSLTFHYLPDLRPLFREINAGLRPGGHLVFSVEHPLMTANPATSWKRDAEGDVFWPLKDYANEGLRVTEWLGAGAVHKYHHRLETYLTSVIEAGFVVEALRESWEGMDASCDPRVEESGHRPYFLLLKASKPQL